MSALGTSRRELLSALAIAPVVTAIPALGVTAAAPSYDSLFRKYDLASSAVEANNKTHDVVYRRWINAGMPPDAALDASLERDTVLCERRLSALEEIIDYPAANIREFSRKMLLLDEQLGLEDSEVRAALLRDVTRLASPQVQS